MFFFFHGNIHTLHLLALSLFSPSSLVTLLIKGHSQLMHMHNRYHFVADLHVTRRTRKKSVSEIL